MEICASSDIIPSLLWVRSWDSVIHLHHQFISILLAHHNLYVSVIRHQLRTLAHRTKTDKKVKRITYILYIIIWAPQMQLSKWNTPKLIRFFARFILSFSSFFTFFTFCENKYVHKPARAFVNSQNFTICRNTKTNDNHPIILSSSQLFSSIFSIITIRLLAFCRTMFNAKEIFWCLNAWALFFFFFVIVVVVVAFVS